MATKGETRKQLNIVLGVLFLVGGVALAIFAFSYRPLEDGRPRPGNVSLSPEAFWAITAFAGIMIVVSLIGLIQIITKRGERSAS